MERVGQKFVPNLQMIPERNRAWFMKQGKKSKSSNNKKYLKDIQNNVKSNYKAQATVTFSISPLIY